MPTYEYRCPDGHEFTRFYKTISAGVSEVECPECGKMGQRQLSLGGGLVFKGSGFYLTDYGKNAHRGGAGPSKSDAGKAEAGKSESAKSEASKSEGSKPETSKTEAKPDTTKPKAESPKPKPKSE